MRVCFRRTEKTGNGERDRTLLVACKKEGNAGAVRKKSGVKRVFFKMKKQGGPAGTERSRQGRREKE